MKKSHIIYIISTCLAMLLTVCSKSPQNDSNNESYTQQKRQSTLANKLANCGWKTWYDNDACCSFRYPDFMRIEEEENSCTIEWEDIRIIVMATYDGADMEEWYMLLSEPPEETVVWCKRSGNNTIYSTGYNVFGNRIYYIKTVLSDVGWSYYARIEYPLKYSKKPEEQSLVNLVNKWKPLR